MNKILLIGFKSCGKTTTGKLLAKHLRKNFFDLDDLLVNANLKNGSIRDLFYKLGEKEFREKERDLFLSWKGYPNGIYSIGAGAFDKGLDNLNIDNFNIRIFIDTDYSIILSRLEKEKNYPFLENLKEIYEKRIFIYKKLCTHKLSLKDEFPEDILSKILRIIKNGE